MELLTQAIELLKYLWDLFVHLDVHLAELITRFGVWTYVILFLVIFCETGLVVTPLLPGDSLLFAAGALAALDGSPISVHVLAALLFVAAVLGDATNYSIGRAFGPKVFTSEKSRFLNRKHLDHTRAFYEKHGGKTIILARFIPIVRTFAPFVAGIGKMGYPRFASYNVVGAACWVAPFLYAGFFFGNIKAVKTNFHIVIVVIILISVTPAIIEILRARAAARRGATA